MSDWWTKTKNGKITKIRKPKSIDALLNEGYSVTHITEEGNDTKILSYSPQTRQEYLKNGKKRLKS